MTLFTKIKKIISGVLLLCVLVNIFPTETFAQTNPTAVNMDAYTGWSNVKISDSSVAKSKYANGVSAPWLTDPIFGNYTQLTDVKLDVFEKGGAGGVNKNISDDYYFALADATGGLKNPLDKDLFGNNKTFEQSKISAVGTNDGKVAYYYKADTGNPILIAYATAGKVFVPPAGFVTKELTDLNVNNKDLNTQQGFLNGVDRVTNKQIGSSYTGLNLVEGRQSLLQEQQNIDNEVVRIQQILGSGKENNADITPARRAELEGELSKAVADQDATRKKVSASKELTNSNELAIGDKCDVLTTNDSQFFTSNGCVITALAILANIALKLSALVLYWTGNLFDYSIEIAVNSAEFLARIGIIEPTWAFVRDALNMTFIFLLLYIAVQILLGKGGYTAKGSIARLVLVAILMNFSLFAAKILIDTSNVISLNIYESIKSKSAKTPNRGNVSERIMTTLGLSSLYKFESAFDNKTVPGCNGVPATILTVGIFGTILLIITSITFLLAALLFFVRMLNIIVLFISSPIWVWGYVMKNRFFEEKSSAWWSNMWHAMKFPVMFMLFLYVSLAMFAQLNSVQVNSKGDRISLIHVICQTSLSSAQTSVLDKLPLVLNFILVIGSLMGIIAYSVKNAGNAGFLGTNTLATNISKKFDNLQKKFTTGAAQGVYNKSRDAAVAAGDGAKYVAGKAKDASLTLAKDLVRTGANKVLSGSDHPDSNGGISGILGRAATEKFRNLPRVQTALAVAASKLKDKKILGETEKEAVERRTKGSNANAKILAEVQAENLKMKATETAWKKENPNGTTAQYNEYTRKKIALIAQTQLGDLQDAPTGKKDSNGNDILTSQMIREGVEEDVEVKDNTGKVIGTTKVINEERLYRNIQSARKMHKESGELLKAENKKRWGFMKTERSKGQIKVQEEALKVRISEASKKKSKIDDMKTKKERLSKLTEKLKKGFPELDQLDLTKIKDYDSEIASYLRQSNIIKRKGNKDLQNAADTQEEMRIKNEIKTDLEHLEIEAKAKIEKKKQDSENMVSKLINEIKTLEDEA
ncbi:MAG: hypothetical protein V4686_02100 [Patescibacteria group bacterium]